MTKYIRVREGEQLVSELGWLNKYRTEKFKPEDFGRENMDDFVSTSPETQNPNVKFVWDLIDNLYKEVKEDYPNYITKRQTNDEYIITLYHCYPESREKSGVNNSNKINFHDNSSNDPFETLLTSEFKGFATEAIIEIIVNKSQELKFFYNQEDEKIYLEYPENFDTGYDVYPKVLELQDGEWRYHRFVWTTFDSDNVEGLFARLFNMDRIMSSK